MEHKAIVDAVAKRDRQAPSGRSASISCSWRERSLREWIVAEAPSNRARELPRGAFDMHLHIAPDVVERKIDDVTLARRFAELGMNPLAVEIAAREGARTVWLPTVDSVNESHEREAPPGAKVPVWVKLQLELRELGIEIEPVPVTDERGELLQQTREVLAMIARHGMVIGAHAADFVWRAGGAIAVTAAGGAVASRRAVLRGAWRVRRAVERGGADDRAGRTSRATTPSAPIIAATTRAAPRATPVSGRRRRSSGSPRRW